MSPVLREALRIKSNRSASQRLKVTSSLPKLSSASLRGRLITSRQEAAPTKITAPVAAEPRAALVKVLAKAPKGASTKKFDERMEMETAPEEPLLNLKSPAAFIEASARIAMDPALKVYNDPAEDIARSRDFSTTEDTMDYPTEYPIFTRFEEITKKLLGSEDPAIHENGEWNACLERTPMSAERSKMESAESGYDIPEQPFEISRGASGDLVITNKVPAHETSRLIEEPLDKPSHPNKTRYSLDNLWHQGTFGFSQGDRRRSLPPPKIIIERATGDLSSEHFSVPGTPVTERENTVRQKDIISHLARAPQPNNPMSNFPRLANTAPTEDKVRSGRRTQFVRKTRRVVLRKPILQLLLGRQLASQTKPVLRIMAEGETVLPIDVVAVDTRVVS